MSDFLTRLAQRQLGQIPTVQPLMPSVYTPYAERDEIQISSVEEEQQLTPSTTQSISGTPQHIVKPQGSQETTTARVDLPTIQKKEQPVLEPRVPMKPKLDPTETRRSLIQPITEDPVSPVALTAPSSSKQREFVHTRERVPIEDPVEPSIHTAPLPPLALVVQKTPGPPVAPTRLDKASNTTGASQPIRNHDQNQPKALSEPPVQVTIGRIEVTAVTQATKAKRATAPRKPSMSLDDYLTKRQGNGVPS